MYLHIGEGLLVRKKDIIMILDARKMVAAENSQLFFDAFPGEHHPQRDTIKSFVMVDPVPATVKKKAAKRSSRRKRMNHQKPLVLVSTIATNTLQKRFLGKIEAVVEIESGEIHGKPTKQL
jgi:hypothetical protein